MAAFRHRWSQLSALSRTLLVLALLTSAGAAVVLGFVLYLFIGAYSGGSNPESVTGLLFPIAIALFVLAGLPSLLLCGVMWAGYSLSTRRSPRGGKPGPPPGSST